MNSERSTQITNALNVLGKKGVSHTPGSRRSGFDDTTAIMQKARRDALTHIVCRGCAHLRISQSGDQVQLRCKAFTSPTDLWITHGMIGEFGTEPQCNTFTALEE